jgi:hypothetical protein
MEVAYRRVKVGPREEAMRAREDFVGVLRRAARDERVTGEMEAVMDSLADRFELMNLRERQRPVEAEKAKELKSPEKREKKKK